VLGIGLYTIAYPIFDYGYAPVKHNLVGSEFSIKDYGAGSHAVITGATSATGRAFSARLKAEGFNLILVDEPSPELIEMSLELEA